MKTKTFNAEKAYVQFQKTNVSKAEKNQKRRKIDNLLDVVDIAIKTDGKLVIKNRRALAQALELAEGTLVGYFKQLNEYGYHIENDVITKAEKSTAPKTTMSKPVPELKLRKNVNNDVAVALFGDEETEEK